jgi:predicted transposase YbfD/YdcC
MILDACVWQNIFTDWAQSLRLGKVESPTEVLAIDGKWSKASGLHTVSVWAAEHHLVLAQEQVPDKTNEITVIPTLLETLDIVGRTITIDAAGTQKQIAWTIREHHGDYVLALKANHKHLFEDVKWLFEQHQAEADWSMQTKGHGRSELRELWLLNNLDFLEDRKAWRDLKAVVKVKSTRVVKGEISIANRYFLTSLEDPETLAYAIRTHWSIENNLHWTLDIAFEDDANTANAEHAQANLVTLRHLSLNQLKRESSLKASIKAKRKRAGWDND